MINPGNVIENVKLWHKRIWFCWTNVRFITNVVLKMYMLRRRLGFSYYYLWFQGKRKIRCVYDHGSILMELIVAHFKLIVFVNFQLYFSLNSARNHIFLKWHISTIICYSAVIFRGVLFFISNEEKYLLFFFNGFYSCLQVFGNV